jgi:hypothetical protein
MMRPLILFGLGVGVLVGASVSGHAQVDARDYLVWRKGGAAKPGSALMASPSGNKAKSVKGLKGRTQGRKSGWTGWSEFYRSF